VGPVSLAAGADYRLDTGRQTVDPLQQQRLLAYNNQQPLAGLINVKEAFAETVVPLAKDVTLAQLLEVTGSIRETNYSTSGDVTTWKLGANYEPIDGLRFRGVYSTDIRAPNINELFSPSVATGSSNAAVWKGAPIQVSAFSAGNPALRPEAAKTVSVGAIVQPSFVPGLSISSDYYRINLTNAIQALTFQQVLNNCAAGDATQCSFVTFNSSGVPTSVADRFANIAGILTEGVDLEASYKTELAGGILELHGLATYIGRYVVTVGGVGGSSIDYAGDISTYGIPQWSLDGSVSYQIGPNIATVDMQRLGPGKYSIATAATIQNNDVSGVTYFNVTLERTLNFEESAYTVYVRAENIFDQAPPWQFGPTNGPGNYDRVGRYFKFGVRAAM
jgi:outer membrane receptor protein involved in Fe transport